MHPLVRGFVEDVIEAVELHDPVFEFGARQVEPGQEGDLRALFAGRPYVGTDLHPGPGVDRVEDLRALSLGDGEVGTAICLETLEHCEDPLAACRELARVVGPGGACLVSAPMLIGVHAYPGDYFRFTPSALRLLLGGFDEVWVGSVGDPDIPYWVFAVAVRGRPLKLSMADLPRLSAAQLEWERAPGSFRIGPLRASGRELAGIVVRDGPRVVRDRAMALLARLRQPGRSRRRT
jgi:SAM-dependent methyltransferase